MYTDLPLKRLTRLRPMDLLPLLGTPEATVVAVETLELPASKTSLDTVLLLRDPDEQPYLHLVEWQGYADPYFLWRCLGYLAWLGQHRPERPIRFSAVYLKPGDDVGDLLDQAGLSVGGWSVQFHSVRLWEYDAVQALESGVPGLLTLAPLMAGATADLVEQAALAIISTVEPPTQGELLAALGVFAEPLLDTERFIRLVTRERLMATDLISYLLKDKELEFAQEKAALVEEKAALVEEKAALVEEKAALVEEKAVLEEQLTLQQEQIRSTLQQAVADVIALRFPAAPLSLTGMIRKITAPARLQELIRSAFTAPDLASVERLLEEAAR